MLRTTFGGSPVREPEPVSRFEEEAREPETHLCHFGCGVEVAEEGDYCSDACREADAEHAAADARNDLETEV